MDTQPFTIKVVFANATPDDVVYQALSVLADMGATGLDLQEAPPITLVAGLPGKDASSLRVQLTEAVPGAQRIDVAPARMKDWSSVPEGDLRPVCFGPLWVVPPGHVAPPGAEQVLRVDAGESFGTGLHPTTALCLEYLVNHNPVQDMLDVGTGTGILALAALATGTQHAVALDHDAEALACAAANARANHLEDRVEITDAAPRELGRRFPLVMANILAAPLIELAPDLVRTVDHGGALVLSGIRPTQVDDVVRTYRRLGAKPLGREHQDDWVLLEWGSPW